MAEFAGKRVLVTGSTRGIGRAAVELFLGLGAETVIHGRSEESVATALAELGGAHVTGCAADLAVRDQVRHLAGQAGEIDILVNCAGLSGERPIEDCDPGFWDRIFEVNVTAPWLLSRALLPALARRRGVIVNIASDSGLLGYPGHAVYCASKGAVIGLTRALATEFSPEIRVLCVCPGPVRTGMMAAPGLSPAEVERQWAALTLLERVAEPSEIAEVIVFAASARSSYATGSLLVADGGTTAGRRP